MNFQDMNIKPEYNSITDDVRTEFFDRVLSTSRLFYRIGGRFTSKNLASCAEGLQEFITNDGIMRLVLTPEFTQDDIKAINRGLYSAHDVIAERWISDFSEIQEKFVKDHNKALAWMLANNNLEIKIAIPTYNNGSLILDSTQNPFFKDTVGIAWDNHSNSISFSGSMGVKDETFGEYWQLKVFRSWNKGECQYLDLDREKFDRYYNGCNLGSDIAIKTISLPTAIQENLLKIAPKSKSEINIKSALRLRPYQIEAINRWHENNNRGILEMATGTGKTFTAIGCLKSMKRESRQLVVVACPFDNLERQWSAELKKWNLKSIIITSGNAHWHKHVKDGIASLERGAREILIVITSYKTFCSKKFTDIVERCNNIPTMLIADEVHNAGSSQHMQGLIERYQSRLGLSATLERYFDPDGTRYLVEYFGGVVYTMSLQNAIEKGFLVNYYYYPIYVEINKDEYEKYKKITSTIARLWGSKKPKDIEAKEAALIKRSKIIRDASNKIDEFQRWVKEHTSDAKHTLIYCSENQMPEIKRMLNVQGITNHEITAKNPRNPKDRQKIIEKFSTGGYDVIVANRVLDEGADIPSAKNCVLVASTGNPKQFVQRRGRILRKFAGRYRDGGQKEHAKIYDMLVVPSISNSYNKDEMRIEKQIIQSQLKRQEVMAEIAKNHDNCMAEIAKIKEKFGM